MMSETILLEQKINEILQVVDTNTQLLATELDKANKRIADLEKRVNWLYDEDLP